MKISKFSSIFAFFRPTQKWPGMAPNVAGRFFFRLIQTLPTFWATRILILRILIFLDPKFPDLQVPDFQISRNLAWAQLGPSLGPAWSRLGPGLGPAGAGPGGPCPDAAGAGAGRTLRSQPDLSPNAPRDQIRRKDPCCDLQVCRKITF